MTYRRNIWGPLASDDIGANVGAPFPAVSILITDSHPPFQFDTLVQTSTTSASTTPIHVGIGFVDEPLAFIDATSAPASPGGAQTSSLTFDELSSLYPRIAWPSLSDQIASMIGEILSQNPLLHDVVERAGPVFDISSLFSGIEWPPLFGQSAAPTDGIVALDTPSQGDAGTGLIQDTGPAGLDWRITPDFDDDPGWHPGVIFPPTPRLTTAIHGRTRRPGSTPCRIRILLPATARTYRRRLSKTRSGR